MFECQKYDKGEGTLSGCLEGMWLTIIYSSTVFARVKEVVQGKSVVQVLKEAGNDI